MRAAAIFSDNMVLQRGVPVRVFGSCGEGEAPIEVSIPELGISSPASVCGEKWEAVLPPVSECRSCTVVIKCGESSITFRNAVYGEVWLAGGQSNMEFELRNEKNGAAELAASAAEDVRFYYTPKCEMNDEALLKAEAESGWQTASEENSGAWSAAAWYFAKELSRRLGVTVGIVGCNWGGTSASAWMSREYLEQDSRIRPYIEEYDRAIAGRSAEDMIREYDEYGRYQYEWEQRMQKCYAEHPDIKWDEVLRICGENRYPGPMGIKNPMRPCGLHETMIERICPYTLRGVIYYQGESDDHRPDTYYTLMKALIENWRHDWRNDELPFIMVQLPMFRYAEDPDRRNWCLIREAQMRVYRTVKNTGIAVALDCGEFNNIHPTDKSAVGHRLYLQALSEVYGLLDRSETLPAVFSYFTAEGDTALLHFENCSGFICTQDEPEGFEAAGADGEYFPAQAHISGDIIAVRSVKVKRPAAVRFKWTNYAEVTLFSRNGLPVPAFRTDMTDDKRSFDGTAIRIT